MEKGDDDMREESGGIVPEEPASLGVMSGVYLERML